MNINKKFKWIPLLLGASIVLAACGTIDLGVETPVASVIVVEEIEPGGAGTAEVTPELTPEFTPEIPTPYPTGYSSQYWVEAQDPRTDVRFALPCYWEYDLPKMDESGSLSSFSLRNYPYSFAESFPRGEGVFEVGGMKIDVLYFKYVDWGVPACSTPRDLVLSLYSEDNTETTLSTIEERIYNNQPVLWVVTESIFGSGISYWYDLSPETVLVLGIVPMEADGHDDIQAILSSVALTPDTAVQMPLIDPAMPPQGLDANCLSVVEYPVDAGALKGTLDCATTDYASLDYAACNVVDGIRSGNISALISWMDDSFVLGYWASEYNAVDPEMFIEELRQRFLPPNASQMTFTNERAKFPPLEGVPPEDVLGQDVNVADIIYSEGWGQDGLGSALLYMAQDEAGNYYWYGMVFSYGQFDR
jgi:hypothetical protein